MSSTTEIGILRNSVDALWTVVRNNEVIASKSRDAHEYRARAMTLRIDAQARTISDLYEQVSRAKELANGVAINQVEQTDADARLSAFEVGSQIVARWETETTDVGVRLDSLEADLSTLEAVVKTIRGAIRHLGRCSTETGKTISKIGEAFK